MSEKVRERLKQLKANLQDLQRFRELRSKEEVAASRFDEWALRYGFLESIQMIIDLACHIVSTYNLGNAKNYASCIRLLAQGGYISKELGEKLSGIASLRNMLVHEYAHVSWETLYDLLDRLEELEAFQKQVAEKFPS